MKKNRKKKHTSRRVYNTSRAPPLVFVSPVRSGLLAQIEGPRPRPVHLYPRTRKDWTGPMKTGLIGLFGPWTGLLIKNLNWFKSIFSGLKLKFWIGRVIDSNLSFKTSPRTLIYVKNWCSYGNILVHLQFSSFFQRFSAIYGFYNIFVSFHPNIMIFGTFWREFKVLPKTGLNRGEPVLQDWSVCGLSILKVKDQDRRSGLFRSFSGPVSVLDWSQDRTYKH